MKQKLPPLLRTLTASLAIVAFAAGCASSGESGGDRSNEMTKEAVLNEADVKGKPPTVFAQPLARVQDAAARALTSIGCRVEQKETYFVSGSRPHKIGLFVGSGGETVKVFMVPQSDKVTNVWVDTDLSFMGIAGQQGWNKQVLAEMTSHLR